MAVNTAPSFSADLSNYIAEKTLRLAQRQLVVYQFGTKLNLPKGQGVTYTASRYPRVALPYAPLSEGVPPVGQLMTLQQVTATALQWGDKITVTDVATMTIKHPLFKIAMKLMAMQQAETFERNTFNNLMGGTQVNYVNSRGARGSLVAGDVLNTHEITRMTQMLKTLGAPRFMGDSETDIKVEAGSGGAKASSDPRKMPHYVTVIHTLVGGDLRENQAIQYAWSHSDLNRLYNSEVGEWAGQRFCESNMVPTFTGNAQINPGVAATGSLATGNYFIVVTGQDTQNQYESQIYLVSNSTAVVGPNGSLTVTLPSTAGYTWSVYIGTANTPQNLGLSPSGPNTGPLQGQATQMAGGQTVTITGIGAAQAPPASPAAGVTVYPTFVFGEDSFGQVQLENVEFLRVTGPDKSDPLNQLRVFGWKAFYGTIIQNNQFFGRIESTSAFNTTFG